MRLVAGDEVAVFDGEGHEYQARVVRADRKGAAVAIGEPILSAPEPAVAAVLVQAVLKGDKMDAVVRDATMAGVARVVPVVTERSVVGLSALARGHAHERWQRIAVASAKQCRRARLPAIDAPRLLGEWLETPFDGRRLLLVEPSSGADGVQPHASGPRRARSARSRVHRGPRRRMVGGRTANCGRGWVRAREPRSDDVARRRGWARRCVDRQLCVRARLIESLPGRHGNPSR